MSIIHFFVSAPSWLIFSIFILAGISSQAFDLFLDTQLSFTLGFFLSIITFYFWIFSATFLMQRKYPDYLSVPFRRQLFCLVFLIVYKVLFVSDFMPNRSIILLQYLYWFCHFYVIYFFSRLLVSIEKRRKVNINEWFITFLFTWIYIVGIWFLQPRINRLFHKNSLNGSGHGKSSILQKMT